MFIGLLPYMYFSDSIVVCSIKYTPIQLYGTDYWSDTAKDTQQLANVTSMEWYYQTYQRHPVRDKGGKVVDIDTALEGLLNEEFGAEAWLKKAKADIARVK